MVQNACTLSDKNYLIQGLTLYNSLIKTQSDFLLHYLCLDDYSFNKLKEINSEKLIPYHINFFLEKDPLLKELKETDYWYFCMTLGSYFSNYLIEQNLNSITYIDSDVFLYKSLNDLTYEFNNKEIAIFKHRQFDGFRNRPEGNFNVGLVYFKNGKFGKKVLKWWSDAVLFRKYPELATCGDQKYLDKFPELCPEEFIFIDGNIGHGAPWQWQLYDFTKYFNKNTIFYKNDQQEIFFNHFSQFKFNLLNNEYVPSTMHHIYTPLEDYKKITELKKIYDDYFNEIKLSANEYKINLI